MKTAGKLLVMLGMCSAVLTAGAAKIGDAAPELKADKWIQGDAVEIKKGQITVVEFWATWCPPCRTSIPHLNDLYKKYKDMGVAIVGISDEKEKTVQSFVKKMGAEMEYPVAIGTAETQAGYMSAFRVGGIPHAFVVDADGKFAWQGHPMDGLDKAIETELAKLEANKKANPEKATLFAAKIGDAAPEIKVGKWIQGDAVGIKQGQITIVEFWATWCPPCRTSIPHLNGIYNKYKDKGVALVGISNEEEKTVKSFVKKMGDQMQYPVAIGTADTQSGYMSAFKVRGIPHAFIVGADGKFAWHGHPMGGLDKAIEAELVKLEAYKKANPEKYAKDAAKTGAEAATPPEHEKAKPAPSTKAKPAARPAPPEQAAGPGRE